MENATTNILHTIRIQHETMDKKCFGKGMRWMEEFHDGQTKRKKFLNEQNFPVYSQENFSLGHQKKWKSFYPTHNHILGGFIFLWVENAASWALNYHSSFSASQQQTERWRKCVLVPSQEKMENPCQ